MKDDKNKKKKRKSGWSDEERKKALFFILFYSCLSSGLCLLQLPFIRIEMKGRGRCPKFLTLLRPPFFFFSLNGAWDHILTSQGRGLW